MRKRQAIEGGWLLECTRCKAMLPSARFELIGARRHSHCDECVAARKSAASAARRKAGVLKTNTLSRTQMYVLQRGICPLCGQWMRPGAKLHVDHRRPVARGGPHVDWNLALTHALCNLRKGKS
jgi:5-methylcytosine-specific restriction endonuclease McrA